MDLLEDLKGGENVEAANINSYVSNLNNRSEGVKKSTTSKDQKEFAKVLKNTKEESKTLDDKTTNKSEDMGTASEAGSGSNQVEEVNGKDLIEDNSKELDSSVKVSKDVSELLQMLLVFSGSPEIKTQLEDALKNKDLNTVKEIVSKLFAKIQNTAGIKISVGAINSSKISESILSLEPNGKEGNNKSSSNKLNELVSMLSNKLISDEALKADIISKIQTLRNEPTVNSSADLKEAILNKLSELIKTEKNNLNQNNLNQNNGEIKTAGKGDAFSILKSDEVIENIGQSEANSLENNSELNKAVQKPEMKEDKLLKELIGDKKGDSKDSFSDKVTNVLTRFENIKLNKPEVSQDKPVIARNTFNTDFVKAIKFMDVNNLKELSVKILPRDLGEIVIRLTMDNGVMKANITAQNKDTYNLLNSQLPSISSQITEQNMAIQSFSLSLGNGESFMSSGNDNKENKGQQKNSERTGILALEDDSSSEGYRLEENSVNILA